MTKDKMDHVHIVTVKISTEETVPIENSETFVKKTSFSAETAATLDELSDTELQSISSIAGKSQGGTFAQRARAAELQAARALRESKSNQKSRVEPGAISSASSPLKRGTLTLRMPRRQKWTPLDLTDHGDNNSEVDPGNASSSGLTLKTKSQTQQNKRKDSSHDGGGKTKSPKRQDIYPSSLNKPSSPSVVQTQELSEYPAALGARISNEFDTGSDSQMSRAMSNEYPSGNQPRASITQNDQPFATVLAHPNAHFADNNAQTRSNEQLEFVNPFPSIPNTTSEEGRYQNNHRYYTPPINHGTDISMHSISHGNYPAVKGTSTAAGNNTRTQLPYQYHLQGLQGQNYNPVPSQNFEQFTGRSSQYGDYGMASQPYVNAGGTAPQANSQYHQDGQFFPGQRYGNVPLRGASNNKPIRSTADIPNDDFDRRSPSTAQSNPFHVESRYLAFEDELQSCVASNPFQRNENLTRKEERAKMEKELNEWWIRDNRVPPREKRQLEEFIANERRAQKQNPNVFGTIGGNKNVNTESVPKDPAAPYSNEEMVDELLLPAMANLMSYKTDPKNKNLNPFGPPPSWAIDHSPGGNQSFFSQQWGQPPQRVGRDPRYRAMQHDGRSSVFEDPTGRFPREEFTHDRGRGNGRWPPF